MIQKPLLAPFQMSQSSDFVENPLTESTVKGPLRTLLQSQRDVKLPRSISIPGRLRLDGQHSIAIQLRGEPRVLKSFRYFVGNVPAAGQFVRCAGVVE